MLTEAQKLYRSAMLMLSMREHAVAELRRKLQAKDFAADAIETLLEDLIAKDWLSNQRYCAAYIRSRSQRGYGWRYIQQALRQQGISAEQMQQALQTEPVDWYQLAIQARHKRFGLTQPSNFKARQKQHRFLQQRGFDAEQIQIALATDSDS